MGNGFSVGEGFQIGGNFKTDCETAIKAGCGENKDGRYLQLESGGCATMLEKRPAEYREKIQDCSPGGQPTTAKGTTTAAASTTTAKGTTRPAGVTLSKDECNQVYDRLATVVGNEINAMLDRNNARGMPLCDLARDNKLVEDRIKMAGDYIKHNILNDVLFKNCARTHST